MHLDGTVEITDRTRVGLFAVLASLPMLVAMIFFVSSIYFKAEATEARVDRQGDSIREQRKMLIEISERTARIETLLNHLAEKQ